MCVGNKVNEKGSETMEKKETYIEWENRHV